MSETAQAGRLLRAFGESTLSDKEAETALASITARLHVACLTLRSLPADGPRGLFSTWPAYRHDYWDWGAEHWGDDPTAHRAHDRRPRFRPTPADIDACLPTLDLMAEVSRPERIVVSARAYQQFYDLLGGWRRVGAAAGVSHAAAIRYHEGVCQLALARDLAARSVRLARCA